MLVTRIVLRSVSSVSTILPIILAIPIGLNGTASSTIIVRTG